MTPPEAFTIHVERIDFSPLISSLLVRTVRLQPDLTVCLTRGGRYVPFCHQRATARKASLLFTAVGATPGRRRSR